jgi:nucleoside-diphosphate-sugar epimerase
VADIVKGTIAAAEHAPPGSTYNLGGGSNISMLEALEIIEEETGGGLSVSVAPSQQGDTRDTASDLTAAQRDLSYAPSWEVARGLAEQVAWHRSQSQATSLRQ